METGSIHREESRTGKKCTCCAVRYYQPVEDFVSDDDPNYRINSASDVFIENQGSTVVKVKHMILNPGDNMVIPVPRGGILIDTLRIRFLAAYNFTQPLALFPMLVPGDRLFIAQTIEKNPL